MKMKRPLYTYTSNLHLLLGLLLALVGAAFLPPCARAEATLWGNATRSLGFGYQAEPGGNDSVAIGDDAMHGTTNADSCVAIGTGALSGVTNSYGVIAIGDYQLANGGDLTNLTVIGNHFFASEQSDSFYVKAAESDPRRAPILYGSHYMYLTATNGVYVNGRKLGDAAYMDTVGLVASVNGATGAVSVTCASIGAVSTNWVVNTNSVYSGLANEAKHAWSADGADNATWATSALSLAGQYGDNALVASLVMNSGSPRLAVTDTNATGGDVCAYLSDLNDLSGVTYDFNHGTNFTKRLYQVLTNIIDRLGGTVTNAPSFD